MGLVGEPAPATDPPAGSVPGRNWMDRVAELLGPRPRKGPVGATPAQALEHPIVGGGRDASKVGLSGTEAWQGGAGAEFELVRPKLDGLPSEGLPADWVRSLLDQGVDLAVAFEGSLAPRGGLRSVLASLRLRALDLPVLVLHTGGNPHEVEPAVDAWLPWALLDRSSGVPLDRRDSEGDPREPDGRAEGLAAELLRRSISSTVEMSRLQGGIHQRDERMRLLAEGVADGLWEWDLRSGELWISPKAAEFLGVAQVDADRPLPADGPLAWLERAHEDDREAARRAAGDHLANRRPCFDHELRIQCGSRGWRWIHIRGLALRDPEGWAYRVAGSLADITERRESEARLQREALHDPLTGLPNRTLFTNRLERCIEHVSRRGEGKFAVLFLDVDRFKLINDSLGHLAGDHLLCSVARRLEACVRPGDTVARLSGDEFTLLLEHIDGIEDTEGVAERIQRELRQPIELEGREVFVTASIGIAMSDGGYRRAEDALRDADAAMYSAKAGGRARHSIFGRPNEEAPGLRARNARDLAGAFERGEFRIHYQPVVDLEQGRVTEVEALLRWQHPERGLVSAGEFLRSLEDMGGLVEVGAWVLEQSCRRIARIRRELAGCSDLRVSVNVSAVQFEATQLATQVARALGASKLDPSALRIEVPESTLAESPDSSARTLAALRDLEVGVQLDDFGSGFSSLDLLQRYPVQTLKIDRTFVDGLDVDHRSQTLVRAVVALGQTLDIEVSAKGLESPGQLERVRELGCVRAQGHLIGPAVGEDALSDALRRILAFRSGRDRA